MKIGKYFLSIETPTKKEAIKMIKKCLAVTLAALIVIFNVVPAQAYTQLATPVTLTATGTLEGETAAFTADLVTQSTGVIITGSSFTFPTPVTSGRNNSNVSLRFSASTNVVGNRIIIATDNGTLFTNPAQDPRWTNEATPKPTGSDGSGMIGATNKGYVVPFIWGASTTPNTPAAYTFGSTNWSWVVDKGHNKTYVPTSNGTSPITEYAALDTANFYRLTSNVAESNPAQEGGGTYKYLYPQYFGAVGENWDLYDKPATDGTRKVFTVVKAGGALDVVGQAIYQNIATIAFGILPGPGSYYTCNVVQPGTTGSVVADIMKKTGTNDKWIYIPVGADFTGVPAQSYSTNKLFVTLVQD